MGSSLLPNQLASPDYSVVTIYSVALVIVARLTDGNM